MEQQTTVTYDIRNASLADEGEARIVWAGRDMPVLHDIREEFQRSRPLKGVTIAACLHVTSETANLMITLKDGGADVALCASNPLSTNDAVAAALALRHDIPVFAMRGEDAQTYYSHIRAVLARTPHITMDDGADLVAELHKEQPSWLPDILGGTEETTTGVIRLRALAKEGRLHFPIIAVNDADTKHMFDNRYGTGQSTLDGVIRATNVLLAGSNVVVCGYGWCGRGIARRAQGMGAHVTVTEVDPLRAIEAVMDGFPVAPLVDVMPKADVVITATGDINVVRSEHMAVAKHGVILANSGHFNDEIDLTWLGSQAVSHYSPRHDVETYVLQGGREIHVLAEGRLVNLAAADGHPASVMDMSFANQALSVAYIASHHTELPRDVVAVPQAIDKEVAQRKLASMGVNIDILTEEQRQYLSSWEGGTS
ncbi:MAG: adenosylhomocysteinase [Candidatus Dormibacteria bacterium]